MAAPKNGLDTTVFSALLLRAINFLDKPAQPLYRGELALTGLHQQVRVAFDRYAVPHVEAADEEDLFFAQGYLHAQERLWQMDLSRRFLSGRMAELFGNSTLPWRELSSQFRGHKTSDLDFFIRLVGVRHWALQSLALLSDQDEQRLTAYSNGINRYIEKCGKKLPWEFRLLRYAPEVWTALDSLTIAKGMAFLLSTALYTRLNLLRLAAKLERDPKKLRSLMPSYPKDGPAISRAVLEQGAELCEFTSGLLSESGWHGASHGSNGWVVAPSKSRSGGAILCNDPHLRMTLPSMFYLMRLKAGSEFECWGASMPGLPAIQLGQNRRIAWGATAALCDDVELYRERLHRIDRDRYLAGGEWRRFTERREAIKIRGGKVIERIVRASRHGPILSDIAAGDATQEVLALGWSAGAASREVHSLYRLNRAGDWQEFLAALEYHSAPSLNFLYADGDGNIGYSLAGEIPRRSHQPSFVPLAGWEERNQWAGYIPYEELPRLYNPPSGIIAIANNKIVDGNYPYFLSNFFEPPHRIRRIEQLLQSQEKFSAAAMAAIQLDTISLHGLALIRALADELRKVSSDDGALHQAAAHLLAWDGNCSASSVAAAIFHMFHQRLLTNLLGDGLGDELLSAYTEILNQCIVPTDKILADAQSSWFAKRSRSELVALSLSETCMALRQNCGADITQWQWGKLHRLTLNHALGRVAILKPAVSLGPMAAGGDGMTVNLGFYRHSNPFGQTVGAVMRYIVDFSDRENSGFVLAAGQSGHPASRHYSDQTGLWQSGARIAISEQPNSAVETCLVLKPW